MFKVGDKVRLKDWVEKGCVYEKYGYVSSMYFEGVKTIYAIFEDGSIKLFNGVYLYRSQMLELVESAVEEPQYETISYEKQTNDTWQENSKEWVWNGEKLININNNNSIRFDGIYNVLELVVVRNWHDKEAGFQDSYSIYIIKQNATPQDLENLARKLGAIRL